jgi:catechol 2,3-dioxygenase-like lactoylglutathione lyase family enzyme
MNFQRVTLFVLSIVLLTLLAPAQEKDAGNRNDASGILRSARPYQVSISVADLDETVKWYRENLGFVMIKKMDLPKYALRIAFVELGGFQLELIEFKQSVSYEAIQKLFPSVDDRAKVQGLGKLAFLVSDIAAVAERLKKKGVKFVRDVTDDNDFGVKWFMVEDNSGNVIQFFQKIK